MEFLVITINEDSFKNKHLFNDILNDECSIISIEIKVINKSTNTLIEDFIWSKKNYHGFSEILVTESGYYEIYVLQTSYNKGKKTLNISRKSFNILLNSLTEIEIIPGSNLKLNITDKNKHHKSDSANPTPAPMSLSDNYCFVLQ